MLLCKLLVNGIMALIRSTFTTENMDLHAQSASLRLCKNGGQLLTFTWTSKNIK